MTVVLLLTTLAVFATMALALVRALKGPRVYDRILAVNVFGTKTVLIVALIAYITGHHDLIDVALVYALINFIAIVAVLKLSKMRDLARAGKGDITDG
ncbi:pH regulation protein F [Wenzhouxiangella sp. AB-CW3]|uniref:monovalent cation/H+ antiporter complex subunit F n=1 Tax=Wenzhouxiangella sp. AB-CW3 TaxID=2771012 RepID=UPI00168A78C4|nr:monovalent cation/H+ antiporter complex subunit F [Wenzhouxiangella sp. AB-CW3]QOC22152.1 pH regulation protein F [Wenzhouxiangella sp. AB-CW3]